MTKPRRRLGTLQIWQATCPLRKWREEHGYSCRNAALVIGVSPQAYINWEDGAAEISPENQSAIEIVAPGLSDEYRKWYANRP